MSKTRFLMMALALAVGLAPGARAAVTATEQPGADGKPLIVIENGAMTVTVNPAAGGRISRFVWKKTGQEWLLAGETGFFLDHVWQQTWPGELLHRPYTARILDRGPERATVEVAVTIAGKGDKNIEGVRLVRTMTVTGNRPAVEVTIRLENPTTEPRSPGLWVQNIAQVGGTHEDLWTFRPSSRGVIRASYDFRTGGAAVLPAGYKDDFLYDPVAGWTALVHPPSGEGVVFLMDYNYLRCLYDNAGSQSIEWWYDQVRLAPGKSFTTKVVMWPVSGLTAVGYADPSLVGDLQMAAREPALTLVNRLVAGPAPVAGPARVKLELLDYDTGQVLQSKEFPKVEVAAVPVEQQFPIANAPFAKNLLARATVTTADGRSHVGESFRPHGAVLGTEAVYKVARPPRVRPLDRPGVIRRTPHAGLRLLHLRGPFHNYYRLPAVARALGAELKYGSYGQFVYGPSLSYFPSDYAELMGYDVIVVDNVPLEAMDDQTQQYLVDYVENGGVLLVIGGHWAFGGGGYMGSKLESVLPATAIGPFDVVKVKRGSLQPAPAGSAKAGTAWLQKLAVRPAAQVLIKAGGQPFWVEWSRGKGRAIIMAGVCYGEAPPGLTLFWEWPGWPAWLAAQLQQAINETRSGGNGQ